MGLLPSSTVFTQGEQRCWRVLFACIREANAEVVATGPLRVQRFFAHPYARAFVLL